MEDGFDHEAAADPLSTLRSAATGRLRQRLGHGPIRRGER